MPGLSIEVLEFADRLLLRNRTGKTVTIYGYEGEPYARVLANGTAEQNVRCAGDVSEHELLRRRRSSRRSRPPPRTPKWEVVDRTGEFEWHDHRIHWMSPVAPAQVKDKSRRTLIFDWQVPIAVGASKGAIDGQLFWTPESSKAPLAVIVIGAVIVVGGAAVRGVRAPPPRARRAGGGRRGRARRRRRGVVRA